MDTGPEKRPGGVFLDTPWYAHHIELTLSMATPRSGQNQRR